MKKESEKNNNNKKKQVSDCLWACVCKCQETLIAPCMPNEMESCSSPIMPSLHFPQRTNKPSLSVVCLIYSYIHKNAAAVGWQQKCASIPTLFAYPPCLLFSWKTPLPPGTHMRPKSVCITLSLSSFRFLCSRSLTDCLFIRSLVVVRNFFRAVATAKLLNSSCLWLFALGTLFSKQFWNQFDEYYRFFTQAKEWVIQYFSFFSFFFFPLSFCAASLCG